MQSNLEIWAPCWNALSGCAMQQKQGIKTLSYKNDVKSYDFTSFLVRPTRFERATYRVGVFRRILIKCCIFKDCTVLPRTSGFSEFSKKHWKHWENRFFSFADGSSQTVVTPRRWRRGQFWTSSILLHVFEHRLRAYPKNRVGRFQTWLSKPGRVSIRRLNRDNRKRYRFLQV